MIHINILWKVQDTIQLNILENYSCYNTVRAPKSNALIHFISKETEAYISKTKCTKKIQHFTIYHITSFRIRNTDIQVFKKMIPWSKSLKKKKNFSLLRLKKKHICHQIFQCDDGIRSFLTPAWLHFQSLWWCSLMLVLERLNGRDRDPWVNFKGVSQT